MVHALPHRPPFRGWPPIQLLFGYALQQGLHAVVNRGKLLKVGLEFGKKVLHECSGFVKNAQLPTTIPKIIPARIWIFFASVRNGFPVDLPRFFPMMTLRQCQKPLHTSPLPQRLRCCEPSCTSRAHNRTLLSGNGCLRW
ncbi:MAG: hypothetical protein UZ07_CHB004000074 [Chlorobi bacterium OLB7]|nr:MAG: hypothetical protein UZ07_CHB004000074 [Chlorobi bacterium OLB7]